MENTAVATITSIEAFIEQNFNKYSSDYIKIEAKILNSFLNRLVSEGFQLVSAHDGEERHRIENNDRFQALDVIFSVDEASLTIRAPEGKLIVLSLVLGNDDATTISDHSELGEELEKQIFKTWADCVKTHSLKLYEENWVGY
mgnify:CR=1 FL=1